MGLIDLHFHLLPGIDDGPADLDAAVALARQAVAEGTTTVVATPHVSWEWRTEPETIAAGVQVIATRLRELGIPLEVVAGAELALTRAIELSDPELASFALGAGPWLLIELPQSQVVLGLEAQLLHLQHRGHQLLLAHVERCPTFFSDPELLDRLTAHGMRASLTAGALVGRFGGTLERFANALVARGVISNVASDAHNCDRRPPGLEAALAHAGLAEQTSWLTQDVPAAMLSGGEIPPPPVWPPPARRSWRSRRHRP
jgi:protein-tyrosine phosphatase